MALKFKLESGIQLLSRLTKKNGIENFYPTIFTCGLKHNEVIEIYSENSVNPLLYDLIAEALLPHLIGGIAAGTVIFNTDGNFDKNNFIEILKHKLHNNIKEKNIQINMTELINNSLKKLFLIDIFDASQFFITIQKLDNILMKYSFISLIVFHSLSAFYWSEQTLKVIKMDLYLKKLLKSVQKITKDFNTIILYTRPEYFSSSKESIENLESCCSMQTDERINYRLLVNYGNNESEYNYVHVQTHEKLVKVSFKLLNGNISWF